jgi:hypothetical protein
MSKKRRIAAGLLIAAVLIAVVFFTRSRLAPSEVANAKEITLSPSDVQLPSAQSQDRLNNKTLAQSERYVIRQDGSQYHLYFVGDGKDEKVIGEMPTLTRIKDNDFRFIDVVSPSGITTYMSYVRFEGGWLGSTNLAASELYALKGNRAHKVLSHILPAGINNIDNRTGLNGYPDKRGNLFVLTEDGTLCVIRDGQIVGKANVRKIGVPPPPAGQPAFPSMFSDAENTYLVVRKPWGGGNSVSVGPVNENEVQAIYRVDF